MHRILSLLLVLIGTVGCSSEPPALPDGPARPPMWVVHDEDTRIVLIGAIHQLPEGMDWTGGRLATELRLADELVLELAPEESEAAAALFAAQSRDEPVPDVTARFGSRAAELRDLVGEVGLSSATADRTESWALALAIGNALAARQRLSGEQGVESVLTRRFRDADRPVSGLETAREQLDMFDTLSPADQDRMSVAAVAAAADAPARTRALLAAWSAGDVDALARTATEAMAATPMLVEPVVHARNRRWAALLDTRMARRGDVIVAVGVGHLVGEASLLDELRARGHRPMRLQ